MNNKGITKVGRERVNITRDGALEIHQVNLSDTGQYMCTVKTINHSSPGVHHTTLVVTEKAEKGTFKLCFWLLVGLAIRLLYKIKGDDVIGHVTLLTSAFCSL